MVEVQTMTPQKILIIEDEEYIRLSLQDFLVFENYVSFSAENGFQGLELAQKENFDLILLDCVMPDLNGFEVARQLRSMGIDVPIIMLTAADSEDSRLAAAQLGVNDFISKPFEMQDLLGVIRYQLRG